MAFELIMPWTGDDTKDVVETVLGGLIAAAVVVTGYAAIEKMGSRFAALFGLILLTLVIMMAWWARTSAKPGDGASSHADASGPAPVAPVERLHTTGPWPGSKEDQRVQPREAAEDYASRLPAKHIEVNEEIAAI
jgi:hypothetical protein